MYEHDRNEQAREVSKSKKSLSQKDIFNQNEIRKLKIDQFRIVQKYSCQQTDLSILVYLQTLNSFNQSFCKYLISAINEESKTAAIIKLSIRKQGNNITPSQKLQRFQNQIEITYSICHQKMSECEVERMLKNEIEQLLFQAALIQMHLSKFITQYYIKVDSVLSKKMFLNQLNQSVTQLRSYFIQKKQISMESKDSQS